MNKDFYYARLENQFLQYRDYASIPVKDNGDPLVPIGSEFEGRVTNYEEMQPYTGDSIYVRSRVVEMLISARTALKRTFPDHDLAVVCGYRHPDVQEKAYFEYQAEVKAANPELEGEELKEAAHRFVAVPEVAGHPTGGAVDVLLITADGEEVSLGPEDEISRDHYVHSPFIEKDVWHKRQILRHCMLQAGFAPTDSEWWHFAYGDKEWAKYYNQPAALFEQIRFCLADRDSSSGKND
ncbi:M15 family metallopeptidase [Brevibacillus reuszeri]|uniref:M15 family metallopeptidase n=1 Tax=Brevibacillus reuszeri TaxID=54915 RepID=UPI00289703A6|nr:M15 family metallopeptidase [Brevibacillus reuszeri]